MSWRYFLIFILFILTVGCGQESLTVENAITDMPVALANTITPSPTPETALEAESKYLGTGIDQAFPSIAHISAIDDNGREKESSFEVAGYLVKVEDYVPRTLELDGRAVFKFKDREAGGYWGTLVGSSQLRGSGSSEIYTVVSGPGGVCCTNYSIVDISSERPKSIFHSEDFGGFREPMEIFDAEGDGIYELMQFDSCFRYFMDDCGSCSPAPRAYFKYDEAKGEYLPIAGIAQEFVLQGHQRSEKWLAEKSLELMRTGDVGLSLDIRRSALAHMVDLLFIGEEQKAWRVFEKYIDDPDGTTRREIKRRLGSCKFYRALKRGRG